MATTNKLEEEKEQEWEDLIGRNNWLNLLNPLNLSLRRLILRCGDLCQVNYDAFNSDQNSRYCGSSRYGKSTIFRKTFFPEPDLFDDGNAATFLYGTSRVGTMAAVLFRNTRSPLGSAWDSESNFIGYVATASENGHRVIYVAWRGTIRDFEWVNVLKADMDPAKPLLNEKDNISDAKIMNGWLAIYTSSNPGSAFVKTSAREQLAAAVKRLVEKHSGENLSVVVTGHSLGASLAVVSAFDLVENDVVPTGTPVAAFVFGSPQVGNKAFKERVERHRNLKILHTRNRIDLIPLYPGTLFGYVDIGTVLAIDTRKSGELKESRNTGDWHNLQGMLHVVAGWNGSEGEFKMQVKRSLALVNKSSGFLKEDYMIPESWWGEKNKGMVLDKNTDEWILTPPDEEDFPVPEF